MLVSTWLDRWSNYNRGNCTVIATDKPHVVRYRLHNSRVTLSKRFNTDAEMQAFIAKHRNVMEKVDDKWVVVQVGDWAWFECAMDNVLVSKH